MSEALKPFEIEIIDDAGSEESPIIEALGIEEGRANNLMKMCEAVFGKWNDGLYGNRKYSTLMQRVSIYAENANELGFMIMKLFLYIGQNIGWKEASSVPFIAIQMPLAPTKKRTRKPKGGKK